MGRARLFLLLFWFCGSSFWVTCLGGSLGKEFITSYMENYGTSGQFQLQITGHFDFTTVSITCDACNQQGKFEKKIEVNKGKMVQVVLPTTVEVKGSKLFSSAVQILADKEVSVVSFSSKRFSTDTALLYPVSSLGVKHYIVAPSAGPKGAFPEFSVISVDGPNVIDIYLKGQVVFHEKTYPAGSKLTVTLMALQGVQLQGTGDLSGTKIISQMPVAVLSGHICAWKNTKCNHVFEQLLPVFNWGKTFMVPPLPWQTKSDILYISASQATSLKYQIGIDIQRAKMEDEQVLQIPVLPQSPVYLTASAPVQVLLYSTGATFRTLTYDTFLLGVPDTDRYSHSYTLSGQFGFHNFALLVAKTSGIADFTVDGKPPSKVEWNPIPGTVFSWGLYELTTTYVPHSVAHPEHPFGLLSMGVASLDGYGTAGSSAEIEPTLTCSNVLCQKGMECKIINGRPNCVPSSEALCWAWGDPHYCTFDGHKYDFQGTCSYTLVKTCGDNVELPFFHIFAKNENRGNKRVSYVGMVTIEVYGYVFTMVRSEHGFVRVNGIRAHLPIYLKDGNLQLWQSGTSVILATDFQLKVSYDWNQHLRITITSAYHSSVCGLCGNNNGDPGDDFQTPEGAVAQSLPAFGESWVVKSIDEPCWHDCHGECKPCQSNLAKQYESEAYCGIITKLPSGPFTPCHAKVDPTAYFEGCVYDVCSNEGHKQSLCDALKAYADACQREGVQIEGWRKAARCPLECPPNSQYQLCGTACPATCLDDPSLKQKPCPAVCVEGCQCMEGFVLSQGTCIPKSSCGCLHEGRPLAPGESFFADEACRKRCTCDPATRKVECAAAACKSSEQCGVVEGVRGCYPVGYGNCSAQGDPHYLSFDKHKFDFQGACAYVFAEVCGLPKGLNMFGVYVQNEHLGGNLAVTWTRSVQINAYEVEIILSRRYPGKVLVNGLLTSLPFTTALGRIKAYRKGQDAVIQMDFGLSVSFDWTSRISVTVPTTYAGALCGLCGNFNGNPADDALVDGSILVPSIPVFGAEGTEAFHPSCNEIVDPKCPGLEAIAERQRASGRECGLLVAKDGPFRECHGHVDQEGAFSDCVYDYCFIKGHYAVTCAALSSYATACQAAGITIYPWRSPTFCPPSCPPNSHFELCATGCSQTCSSLYIPVPCLAKCEEGCVCNEGFVTSGDACVPMGECGCFYQGQYYPSGDYFYPTCKERCQCLAGGDVGCVAVSCGPNEECILKDGYRKCYPIGNATCSAAGPLYLSYDGLPFDFQGTCVYILSKLHKTNKNLQPIMVSLKNEASGNGKINTKSVHVEVFDFALTLLRSKWGLIKVNGIFHRLPVNLLGGQLRIYQHGFHVRIDTAFGFSLSYNLLSHVRVTIPSIYQDQMGGLCGNYNRQKDDDLMLPDGTVVSDVAEFGVAWKIPVSGISCSDGCLGSSCPVCHQEKKEFFKQRSYCGILTASDGPFSACHAIVEPNVYLNNCILDLCISSGDKEALCRSVQSYAATCQEARVNIQPWRSPSFCPLPCPANSHYAICSNICENNCAGLTDHLQCPETCAEGCQCDDGFFFDGLQCISLDECGCFERGRYFPVGGEGGIDPLVIPVVVSPDAQPEEPIVLNNCTEECVCSPAGGLICDTHACSADEACEVKDGIMECYKKDPCKAKTCQIKETCHIKEGQAVCVPDYMGICWGWGDPHFHTYDGYSYDFQGTCTYVLSQSTGGDMGLVPFIVETKNENRGNNKAVSYVRQVTIRVYGLEITILKGENGRVQVNGLLTNLPVSLLGGQVRASSSGTKAVVQTNFGLEVTFDWNWHVVVHLPSSYYNNTGGLCGNINQLPGDDRRAPDGSLLPTVAKWAAAWTVDGDPECTHECSGQCPTCDGPKLEKYKVEAQCGVISAPAGPFRQCHSVLDPQIFLDNCAYDVCMNGGDHDILCQAVSSYAQACHQKGQPAGDWRTSINCHLSCPENSHYEACGSGCPASCLDRNAPSACQKPCMETCQCDDGYILSVDKCVPVGSCGCTYNGFYYKPGEELWDDEDCGSHCTCDSSLAVVVCKPAGCKADEECRVVNGVRGCHPSSSTCSGDCPPCASTELESYHKVQYCGLLNQADGPFASCQEAVPVSPFFNDCIKKTCDVQGGNTIWCEVITDYVSACQAKSFPLQEWRTKTFCPYACPAHSHYELCGTRCAATCDNPQRPTVCKAPCAEGCICDAGFILSGDHCVPITECVCEHQGKYYKIGDEFFSNAFCREQCRCMEDGFVQCSDFCTDDESCKVVDGDHVCLPREKSTCYALDAQHFITFDGLDFSLPALCSYILAQSDRRDELSIIVSAGSNGVEEVQIQVSGHNVVLHRGWVWEALVNGEHRLLPAVLGDVLVSQEGRIVLLHTHSGLSVYYDHNDFVAVSVPSTYQGLVKGLCGNFNKDKNDDFLMANGKQAKNFAEFGASWKVKGSSCSDGCGATWPICGKDMEATFQTKSYCGMIQANEGPFSGCHSMVDPAQFFSYCVFSMCATSGAPESLCHGLQAYATACQSAGATIGTWRLDTNCSLKCLNGAHYESCTRSCNTTCARGLQCRDPCFEGCICDAGTWANGPDCVDAGQCGCWHDGRFTKPGESYLSSDCKVRCTCQQSGSIGCVDYNCGDDETCGLSAGQRGCFPTEGRCTLMPGAEFNSFDGLHDDFPDPGTYQLASLCDVNSENWFRLIVGITLCPPAETATVTLLHVFFKGLFVTMNGQKKAWVNGLPVQIPTKITDSVTFDLANDTVILRSPQIQVTLSSDGEIVVTVGRSLAGAVCGVCGNFNHDESDDMKGPDGMEVNSVSELLTSWTARDFTPCLD